MQVCRLAFSYGVAWWLKMMDRQSGVGAEEAPRTENDWRWIGSINNLC